VLFLCPLYLFFEHLPEITAGIRTFLTGFGTHPAMFVVVFGTFFAAGIAYLDAQFEVIIYERAVVEHQYGKAAHFGAFLVETDAISHHLHIVLFQARAETMVAGIHTIRH